MEFTKKDVSDFFTSAVLTRARKIRAEKKVKYCEITDAGVIIGKVRGSSGELYKQNIAVYEEDGVFTLDDECTCPVGIECKHSAAVLLEVLERQHAIMPVEYEPIDSIVDSRAEKMIKSLQAQGLLKIHKLDDKTHADLFQRSNADLETMQTKTEPLSKEIKTWFGQLENDTQPEHDATLKHTLLFVLDLNTSRSNITSVTLEFFGARVSKSGLGELKPFEFKGRFDNLPAYASRDAELLRIYLACRDPLGYAPSGALEDAPLTIEFIKKLLETGRCYWHEVSGEPFKLGATRVAKAIWRVDARGVQRGGFEAEPIATLELPFSPPWFVDTERRELGALETGISNRVAKTFLSVPPLKPELVPAFLAQFDAK